MEVFMNVSSELCINSQPIHLRLTVWFSKLHIYLCTIFSSLGPSSLYLNPPLSITFVPSPLKP